MLIVLLMPFLVCAEWVEISQNHYRKEPHRNVLHSSDLTTSKYNNYNNDSITEYQWSKGYVDRIPNIGIVQRQRIHNNERRPSVITEKNPFHHEDTAIMHTGEHRFNSDMKPIIPVRKLETHENRNKVPHNQRTRRPTMKIESNRNRNEKNVTENKSVLNENNKGNGFERENDNFDKFANVGTLGTTDQNFDGLSKSPPVDFTKKNKVVLKDVTTEKDLQNNNEKISNIRQKLKPEDEKLRNKTKNNGIDTLIKFLKFVSQTIQRSTSRSFNGKVRYLEDLKDTLLASIEAHIESEFPDDSVKQRRRRSETESRGHVEFPSSESALMTISFLTFAVFLIKLVLQVIHTYKAKTMMVTPAVVATVGRSRILNKTLK